MKKRIFLATALLVLAGVDSAQAEAAVTDMVIAEGREGMEPVNPGTTFSSDLPYLWCFIRINGLEIPDSRRQAGDLPSVFHVWSRKEGDEFVEITKIQLFVGAESWRTRSRKTIHPDYEGEWRVQVLDEQENVLATIPFTIRCPSGPE